MSQYISGPGVPLPIPQNLYPHNLNNAPLDTNTNKVCLAPGDVLPVPAGDWYINLSQYLVLQFQDPVTGSWTMGPNAAWNGGHQFVVSDGFTCRIANLTGCPCTATVTSYGSGYVQATTTITATPGNSTWLPIVGGQLGFGTVVTANAGAGYGVAPEVFFSAPPAAANNPNGVGGIAASGWVAIASGTVSGFTFTNPGAGYTGGQTVILVPAPTDPNLATGITNATLTFTLTNTTGITGAICTNNGAPLANPNGFTLTVNGAGNNGTVVGNVLQTVTAVSVSTLGQGYGTVSALVTSVGGVPATGSISLNAEGLGTAWRPRPLQAALTVTGTGTINTQVGAIYDGGLFLTNTAPGFVIITQAQSANTLSLTAATIALTMGNRPDVATMQPAP